MILVVDGLYEGLGLSSAIFLKKQGIKVSIIHSMKTSRSKKDVDDLYLRLSKLDIPIYRYDTNKEMESILLSFKKSCKGVLISKGQRAYDFKMPQDFYETDLIDAINNEINSLSLITRLFLPEWKKKRNGFVITFGYYRDYWNNNLILRNGGIFHNDSTLFKCAKSAKYEFISSLSNLYYKYGIRFNIIEPGRIKNLTLDEILDEKNTSDEPTSLDVAKTVYFLTLEDAKFITNARIPILSSPTYFVLKRNENEHCRINK